MSKKELKTKDLQFLSSGSKIGVQAMWFIILVVIPRIFPGIIKLDYPISLTINIVIALLTSIIFEVLKPIFIKKGRSIQPITNIQLLTSVFLLAWFLHVFGRINGPFFVLYLLTIMESALNLSLVFPNIVVIIASFFTLSEFVFLTYTGEVILSLYSVLQLFIRLISLFFMRSYGISLAQKFINEQAAKDKIQTYAKNLEEVTRELENANERLQELDKQKDEFISIAAHELRTPLTAINGYISMLLDGDAGKLPDKVDKILDRTSLAAGRMVRLINNLLDVGRIEEGRIVYRMDHINLVNVVKNVFSEFEAEAKMRNLKLTLNVQEDIRDRVYVDSDRIHEVVGNLMTNAYKYTEKGSVKMKVSNKDGNSIRVEVSDTGFGITEDDQKNLFQKYYRSKLSAGKVEGTGLGLYVTRLLVEKFGGRIGVFSKVSKGSTFWFDLPLTENADKIERYKTQKA